MSSILSRPVADSLTGSPRGIGSKAGAGRSFLAASLRTTSFTVRSRGHHQFLAKAFGHSPPNPVPKPGACPSHHLRVRGSSTAKPLAEIFGLAKAYCRGQGRIDAPCIGGAAPCARTPSRGGVPQAAGFVLQHCAAPALDGRLCHHTSGLPAVNIGSVLETFNLAAACKLPVSASSSRTTSTRVATGPVSMLPRASPGSAAGPGSHHQLRVDGKDALA